MDILLIKNVLNKTEGIKPVVVEGNPKPKQRARKGKAGNWYTPQETSAYTSQIAWVYKKENRVFYKDEKLALISAFYRLTRHRVDTDNLKKSLMDGLQKGGEIAYSDDSQIKVSMSYVRYDPDNPRTEFYLFPIPEENQGEFI